jgi:hypothetical protein
MNRLTIGAFLLCFIWQTSCSGKHGPTTSSYKPPPTPLPDLIVESVDFQPKNPSVNDIVKIHPTIRNIGNAPVDIHHQLGTPFWVSRHIDGVVFPDAAEKVIAWRDEDVYRYIAAGEALTLLNSDFRYPGPGYEIEIVVDSDYPDGPYITESDETNNRLVLQIDDMLDR